MKKIELDGRLLCRSEEGHAYIKKMMGFPEYYGKNLDALYDLLTELGTQVEIQIGYCDEMDKAIKKVFIDASNENNNLNIVLTK